MYVALEIPWGLKFPGVNYWKERKIHVFNGPILPQNLQEFRAPDYSFGKWQEDELNGMILPPTPSKVTFTPRKHQTEAAKKIVEAYNKGWPGFLLADKTGIGKGLAGSTLIPTPNGYKEIQHLEEGDEVLSLTGNPTIILEKSLSKAASFYKITFSDDSYLYTDSDHRWLTTTRSGTNTANNKLSPRMIEIQEKVIQAQDKKQAVFFNFNNAQNNEEKQVTKLLENIKSIPGTNYYHPQEVLEVIHSFQNGSRGTVKDTLELKKTLLDEQGRPNHYLPAISHTTLSKAPSNNNGSTMARTVIRIEEVSKEEEYYCISVDAKDHLYLAGESLIPTHNTLSAVAGVTVISARTGHNTGNKAKVLIVCPKSAIPQWRNTLNSYPLSQAYLRPLIINYQQLNKLLEPPATAKAVKKRRTKERQTSRSGTPAVKWDFVIFDEAHNLKNYPKSLQSNAAVNLAELNKPYRKDSSPFTLYVTATPGSSPLNFATMSQFLSRLLNPKLKKPVLPKEWGEFLEREGFNVKKGKSGYTWGTIPWFGKNSKNPKERIKYEKTALEIKKKQRVDAQRIGLALKHNQAPFLMRSPSDIAGWPEQQKIPFPLELSRGQRRGYEEAWSRFRNWLKMTPAKSDPKGALVETLRYRQKISLLKVDPLIDSVADFVETGNQVYVSVQFMETIDRYRELLEKKKLRVAEISGRVTGADREEIRQGFQKGEYDVVLSTVVDTISLHAGETLPDGSTASKNPRITVIHDVRMNDLQTVQSLGRAHRDGKNSIAFFPYFENTVDEDVINSFVNKNVNLQNMLGEDNPEELESLFREAAKK